MTIRVSVVVPTFKRPTMLSRCLAALATQSLDPAEYEVIVVDDAGGDETRALVERWAVASARAARYIGLPSRRGPAAARNRGWQSARGPIVAFTDDDCVPSGDWLAAGLAAFADDVAGVWGRIVVPLPPRPSDFELNSALLADSEFVTANCFCRRADLAAVGGFDERFTEAWREDSDLYFTLLERGKKLIRTPEAVVVHPVKRAPWGISLSQQRKVMFNALLYKKHPSLYRRHIQPSPVLRYNTTVASLLVALVCLALGKRRPAVVAGSLWLLLTGDYCIRRLHNTSRAPSQVADVVATSALIPPLSTYWRLLGALKYRGGVL